MRLSPPAFWQAPTGLRAGALAPLGRGYAGLVARRMARAVPYRAEVPVVCVGNVTMGGVGKTPFALLLAGMLAEAGASPHVLTRGYGGAEAGPHRVGAQDGARRVGDEPLLLARAAPCWVAHDRAAGARAAVAGGAGVIVMDDGFQNPGLAKDLSFLLIDAEAGLGNGRVFPAGPLREPAGAAFGRADAAVLVGAARDERVVQLAAELAGAMPVLHAALVLDPPRALRGTPVHAVAGIGRPERFFAALRRAGVEVSREAARPDHYRFRAGELPALADRAAKAGAVLVTTQKDWVRLDAAERRYALPVPARMVAGDEAALRALLGDLIGAAASA